MLAWFKLHADWCYNGSQVTYSSYTATGDVTVTGQIGGIQYDGVPAGVSEAFQIWNGHFNGQVKTYAQAKFHQTIFYIGEVASIYPSITLYGRYNGTWTTSGTCNLCSL